MFRSQKHTLQFRRPSGTSRGVLKTKDSWLVSRWEKTQLIGIGECSIIEGLSPEDPKVMDDRVMALCEEDLAEGNKILKQSPSIAFGREIFMRSKVSSDPFRLYDNGFTNGAFGIPINGLIWMGTKAFMYEQIRSKLAEGFRCIKLKIGAIDFEEELSLLKYIRSEFSADDVELRVDANGAFAPKDALDKLSRLAAYGLHSIEQPIKQGQWEQMAQLCTETPLDIALDEELIGLSKKEEKRRCLEAIQPHYIILKPSLVGGWASSEEWIQIAQEKNIGWWATSALESNIGLNAISQWVGSMDISMPQGLGTGGLYTNNIPSPLYIKDAAIWIDPEGTWDLSVLQS